MNINPDRARSRLQQMTNTQLCKFADKHHIDKTNHGRRMSKKQLIARLMLDDGVLQELGAMEVVK